MTLSSVLLILLHVCSLQQMVVAMPTCQLEGDLVQQAHHLLRDLVRPLTFKQKLLHICATSAAHDAVT